MALEDLLIDIEMFFIDITEYSVAEKNKKKYKKIAKDLGDKIDKCEKVFPDANSIGSSIHNGLISNGTAAQGAWKGKFDDKETVWNTTRTDLEKKMREALKTANERKNQALALAESWAQSEKNQEDCIRKDVEERREEKKKKEEKAKKERQKLVKENR